MLAYACVVRRDLPEMSHYPDCDVISGAETRLASGRRDVLHLLTFGFFSNRKNCLRAKHISSIESPHSMSMTKSQEGRRGAQEKEQVLDLALMLPSG